MQAAETYDVVIAGGGLAGLAASIQLARAGCSVLLLEKLHYPFHRVCGEYISEESRPFLERLGVSLANQELPQIRKLQVSAPDGRAVDLPLDPGGFGISRFRLDALLAEQARFSGVHLREGTLVSGISYLDGSMQVELPGEKIRARVVIGATGKRSNLDIRWKRSFVQRKADKLGNFIGIKYHVRYPHPEDTIYLHNFRDGYCGMSRVEEGLSCLCYLTNAANLVKSGQSIRQMETEVLALNPRLAEILSGAERVWASPLSISQVSFARRSQVEDHVLMVGDAAGLITPLCGNGMSMALHASKLAVEQVLPFLHGRQSRAEMEANYTRNWEKQFGGRLRAGRVIQRFFGDPVLTGWLLKAASGLPGLAAFLVRQTHGDEF